VAEAFYTLAQARQKWRSRVPCNTLLGALLRRTKPCGHRLFSQCLRSTREYVSGAPVPPPWSPPWHSKQRSILCFLFCLGLNGCQSIQAKPESRTHLWECILDAGALAFGSDFDLWKSFQPKSSGSSQVFAAMGLTSFLCGSCCYGFAVCDPSSHELLHGLKSQQAGSKTVAADT